MAKGLRDLRRRIRSVQNMKQVTRAMEMIAAANLKRSEQAAIASRPYSEKIREVISSIAASGGGVRHPMLVKREVKKTGYLVITSDRGLAGGYNANVLRKLTTTLRERHASPDEYVLLVIGRKGRDFCNRRGLKILQEVTGLPDMPKFADIKKITAAAVNGYANGDFDELNLIYNEYRNPLIQVPVIKTLLPLSKEEFAESKAKYEYEPSAEAVLEELLPKYAETMIYSAMLEAKASEFGARMTAMGNATKNAQKMIDTYTLEYNRARQAAITQEIMEVVAGANALS